MKVHVPFHISLMNTMPLSKYDLIHEKHSRWNCKTNLEESVNISVKQVKVQVRCSLHFIKGLTKEEKLGIAQLFLYIEQVLLILPCHVTLQLWKQASGVGFRFRNLKKNNVGFLFLILIILLMFYILRQLEMIAVIYSNQQKY